MSMARELVAELLRVSPQTLKPERNYRKDTELWSHDGRVYCAPAGWRRPPAKFQWHCIGHARGRPVFIKAGERDDPESRRIAGRATHD
jgi:hypothetical protein